MNSSILQTKNVTDFMYMLTGLRSEKSIYCQSRQMLQCNGYPSHSVSARDKK